MDDDDVMMEFTLPQCLRDQSVIDFIQAERIVWKCSTMDEIENKPDKKCLVIENDNDDSDSDLGNSEEKISKIKRIKYPLEQRSLIIGIFEGYECKKEAMLRINQMKGCEGLEKRKILRWISSKSNFTMGRPISEEFEAEVIKECKTNNKDGSTLHKYIKKCATVVLNREYWDEDSQSYIQKWLNDTRTRNLQFTSRWIKGFLTRSGKKNNISLSSSSDNDGITSMLNSSLSSDYLSTSDERCYIDTSALSNTASSSTDLVLTPRGHTHKPSDYLNLDLS